MIKTSLSLVLILSSLMASTLNVSKSGPNEDNGEFVYYGSLNGNDYFYSTSVRSWQDNKSLCENLYCSVLEVIFCAPLLSYSYPY